MKLESNLVVVPSKELDDIIQTDCMYHQQIACLEIPDLVNKNITCVKATPNAAL